MHIWRTAIPALLLALVGCGKAPKTTTITLPMETEGPPVIELIVNGRGPFRFVLDTGASMGAILPVMADELGLTPSEFREQTVRLKSVQAGSLMFEGVEVSIIDFPLPSTVRGIVSAGMFAEYLVELNYPAGQLKLKRGKLEATGDAHVLPYTLTPLITVDITVAGREVPVHLDTGSPAFCSIPDAVAEALAFHTGLQEAGRARIPGKEVTIRRGRLRGELVIGGYSYNDQEIDVATLMGHFGNIGYQFLKDKIITLDQKNQLLRIGVME